jgi:hypothetical protein
MADENTRDREKQHIALHLYRKHLLTMGIDVIRTRETAQEDMLPYDAEVWVNGLFTGVIEVKCINYRSDQVAEWGHLGVKKPQMTRLREMFYKRRLNGKYAWSKNVTILVRCKDNVCFVIDADTIMNQWLDSEVAPEGWAKTNHGKATHDNVEARFIKLAHWHRFEHVGGVG